MRRVIVLLCVLLLPAFAYSESPQVEIQQDSYTELIEGWIKKYRDTDLFVFKVRSVRDILIPGGVSSVKTISLNVYYKEHSEWFLLFIEDNKIIAWQPLGEAPIPYEDEDEEKEEFSHKDIT